MIFQCHGVNSSRDVDLSASDVQDLINEYVDLVSIPDIWDGLCDAVRCSEKPALEILTDAKVQAYWRLCVLFKLIDEDWEKRLLNQMCEIESCREGGELHKYVIPGKVESRDDTGAY